MGTEFKLLFEGKPDLEIDKFRRSLPPDFRVAKKDDGIYVTIESVLSEDERCQYLIDRELDRHFFLTCVRIRAEMVRSRVTVFLTGRYRIHSSLPDDIHPQGWNYELPIQLRLWSIAADSSEVRTKLIILFQIIELAYPRGGDHPAYPAYTRSTQPPHPLAECKFIRDLVAHSGDVSKPQLKLYCAYLGLPEVMLDITDPHYYKIIASKAPLMEAEAKKVIEKALSNPARGGARG